MAKKILAITVKPVLAPETRYRILQYIDPFNKIRLSVDHRSLLNEHFFKLHISSKSGAVYTVKKLIHFFILYIKMVLFLAGHIHSYDFIWISREVSPVGPPIFEKLFFFLKKQIILDIDDAIYLHDPTSNSFIHNYLRDFRKFEKTGPLFKHIVCGNNYLAQYFKKFNNNVMIIPTVVPISHYQRIKKKKNRILRIGWIGTPTNYAHFRIIKEPVCKLAESTEFIIEIVGLNERLNWPIENIFYTDWRLKDESTYFGRFDIGIMPLIDNEFTKGKCAFKIIQYMAAGIPVVASPVGANVEVIRDGTNGFLAKNEKEWYDKLKLLIENMEMRTRLGREGFETVHKNYSLESQWEKYAEIFS